MKKLSVLLVVVAALFVGIISWAYAGTVLDYDDYTFTPGRYYYSSGNWYKWVSSSSPKAEAIFTSDEDPETCLFRVLWNDDQSEYVVVGTLTNLGGGQYKCSAYLHDLSEAEQYYAVIVQAFSDTSRVLNFTGIAKADFTAPTSSVSIDFQTDYMVALTYTESGEESGIGVDSARLYYRKNDGLWKILKTIDYPQGSGQITFEVSELDGSGQYDMYVISFDRLGNVESKVPTAEVSFEVSEVSSNPVDDDSDPEEGEYNSSDENDDSGVQDTQNSTENEEAGTEDQGMADPDYELTATDDQLIVEQADKKDTAANPTIVVPVILGGISLSSLIAALGIKFGQPIASWSGAHFGKLAKLIFRK